MYDTGPQGIRKTKIIILTLDGACDEPSWAILGLKISGVPQKAESKRPNG